MDREKLGMSFELTAKLRKRCEGCEFFVLFDSLKQSCCTDVLGAEHVNYDCLVHFGRACFSEEYVGKHYYIFEEGDEEKMGRIEELMRKDEVFEMMI